MIAFTARLRAATPYLHPARMVATARGVQMGLADWLMVGTMAIWSINVTSVKVVVGVIQPLGFGVIRYAVSTLILFLLLRVREGSVGISRRALPAVAVCGAVGFGLNQIGFLLGIHLVHASLAAIILATSPLITAVCAAIWSGEPLRRRTLVALGVSFAGVIEVIAGEGLQMSASLVGGLLILLSAATLGISAIVAKIPLRRYSPLRVTSWMALFGTCTLLPGGIPGLVTTEWSAVTPGIVGAAAFTVIGSTVIGNLAWNYAVQQLGAARTSTYTFLQPVLGVATAVVLLGDRLNGAQILGGVVVLLGLLLYPRKHLPRSSTSSGTPVE
jgi:drug/metabolite transporter (DMT)-like permease